jgi:hypothetical protein
MQWQVRTPGGAWPNTGNGSVRLEVLITTTAHHGNNIPSNCNFEWALGDKLGGHAYRKVCARWQCPRPTNRTNSSPTGGNQINLRWKDTRVERGELFDLQGGECEWTLEHSVNRPAGTESFSDLGLTPGTR